MQKEYRNDNTVNPSLLCGNDQNDSERNQSVTGIRLAKNANW